MIVHFSGTGNSAYVAEKIGKITGDTLVNMNEKLKEENNSELAVNGKLIAVAPTYAWRLPRIAEEWLNSTPFTEVTGMWFVMTCGGEIGNAAKYNKRLCEEMGFPYMGTAQIVMPENYIAMFHAPKEEQAKRIVAAAEPIIEKRAAEIAAEQEFPAPRNNLYDRYMSRWVNPLFYTLYVKADSFYADDRCVGCGKCAELCSLNNITINNGKPVWGSNCTHCMACIAHCPTGAIEYGKKTRNKPRYYLEYGSDSE